GETSHYDYVCSEAARGIMDVQLRTGVPCAFGVLTVDNMDQALARTGGGKRDQGAHAAEAVGTLARPKASLQSPLPRPLAGPGPGPLRASCCAFLSSARTVPFWLSKRCSRACRICTAWSGWPVRSSASP